MNWLPLPSDSRTDLRTATDTADAQARLSKLAALSEQRLDFLQTIQLGQALSRTAPHVGGVFPTVRLAMLSSSTADHLEPAIRVAGLRRRLLLLDIDTWGHELSRLCPTARNGSDEHRRRARAVARRSSVPRPMYTDAQERCRQGIVRQPRLHASGKAVGSELSHAVAIGP
jgi:hypothetical protein